MMSRGVCLRRVNSHVFNLLTNRSFYVFTKMFNVEITGNVYGKDSVYVPEKTIGNVNLGEETCSFVWDNDKREFIDVDCNDKIIVTDIDYINGLSLHYLTRCVDIKTFTTIKQIIQTHHPQIQCFFDYCFQETTPIHLTNLGTEIYKKIIKTLQIKTIKIKTRNTEN